MTLGPKGGLIYGEFKGPPDYRHFRCAYDVWAAALIMLDTVLPPWLIAFADKMSAYDATYGHGCWPLLYQCIDRFLHEHLPIMLRREDEKPHVPIDKGGSADFKPSNPWDYIMYLATTEEA